jgi:hypothetical protein
VVYFAPDVKGRRREIFLGKLQEGGGVVADNMTNPALTHVITTSLKVFAASDAVAVVSPVRAGRRDDSDEVNLFSPFLLYPPETMKAPPPGW